MRSLGAIVFLPRESAETRSLLLEDILFDPAAFWLAESLKTSGVDRFLVVCHDDDRAAAAACFPEDTIFVTTGADDAQNILSAFLAAQAGPVTVVTRPVLPAPAGVRWNLSGPTGLYHIDAAGLSAALTEGGDFEQILARNGTEAEAALAYPLRRGCAERMELEQAARQLGVRRMLEAGIRLVDPNTVYVGPAVTVGAGSSLLPGTILCGRTQIGAGCEIGPNSKIRNCRVGDRVTVNASQLNESTVESDTTVGPFAYIRPNCHIGQSVKVGDFVELKNSTIGDGTKISHLTYVGDSDVGSHVNFGCGTVTVNYDGTAKYRTTIGDHAFIGCNTNLVAPVKVGDGAYTAAGSTITDDVPGDSLAIARSAQTVKVQWVAKRRKRGRR
ncbi:MAG: UDP-N-acetylglucosamine diphosphorylase [Intestinimonas sp.]|jgi:bifunctional UDP-N-acetylglucosamine pyrophosphorylase/glucosamine-1-phosphate N-acetyltransferase|nr:UDP-N-acetylglucosamine diphosphorylase [Intestinimonas sp.]